MTSALEAEILGALLVTTEGVAVAIWESPSGLARFAAAARADTDPAPIVTSWALALPASLTPGMDEEAAWDALGAVARQAIRARSDGRIVAAALAVAGRGRIIGPLDPDRLIRFGVSRWR